MGWVDLIVGVARRAEEKFGGLGPLTPEEVGAFAANAFIGAESLYLLGLEKKGVPLRQALRRVGDLIRLAERGQSAVDVMRAKMPSHEGFAERDGVKLHYEIYGEGPDTMVFLPPWAIVHSRIYKAQLPYFGERFRCIAYDPRGNGKSDRPADVAAYSLDHYVADALAVMDACDAGKAILVGLSFGGMLACVLAAHHPERVKAAILVGTVASIGPPHYPYLGASHFLTRRERHEGWDKYNREHWLTDYPDFAEHFIRNIHSEPHSTRQIEDGIEWAQETSGPVLVKTVEARALPPQFDVGEAMYRRIRCPLLIIHGDDDRIQRYDRAKAVADVTGAELVTIPGGGHNPLGRFPAKTNALIVDFLDRRLGIPPPARRACRRTTKAKRALYLSSPIGLGHGRRDIAIARELRELHPDLQVDWLAQDPVTRLLAASGERVHPLSAGSRASRATSSWSRASTICTASRRSAAWTRC